jgi:predicted dehydrogenase
MTHGIRIGIAGLGFMGQTHLTAYNAASLAGFPNTLVAVCDQDPDRRRGQIAEGGNIKTGAGTEQLFNPDVVAGYESPAELFADPSVDLVSICTPTDSHVELALAAIAAGKHSMPRLFNPCSPQRMQPRPLSCPPTASDSGPPMLS